MHNGDEQWQFKSTMIITILSTSLWWVAWHARTYQPLIGVGNCNFSPKIQKSQSASVRRLDLCLEKIASEGTLLLSNSSHNSIGI